MSLEVTIHDDITSTILQACQLSVNTSTDLSRSYQRHSNYEIPFDLGIVMQLLHIHAENASEKGQREKDESDPTQPPQACIELEGLPSVADADRFVHLGAVRSAI